MYKGVPSCTPACVDSFKRYAGMHSTALADCALLGQEHLQEITSIIQSVF
jgi:hypothetical protein